MGKLDIYTFGRELIRTKDLDPVYVLLYEAGLRGNVLKRWLLAYWCFYHVGTASWIAEKDLGFWHRMETAAGSKTYPRSAERRHYRGANALNSVAWLKARGLEALFRPLFSLEAITVKALMSYVQTWIGFGSWIAFKVADMVERLGLRAVGFDEGAMFLFDSPRDGASLLWETEKGRPPSNGEAQSWAVERVLGELGGVEAPPRYERVLNVQEAETILCKWKSHMGGRYHVGEDVAACSKALERFRGCPLADKLEEAGRSGGLW